MQETSFDVIRHGQTDYNLEHRMQGQSDTRLNGEGRNQARQWSERLQGREYSLMLRSDLKRTAETAAIINRVLSLQERVEQNLREQDWGEWAGRTVLELDTCCRAELEQQESLGWGFTPPGGESRAQVRDRAVACLHRVAQEYPGKRILVVTHLGVIKGLVFHALGGDWLRDEDKPFKNRLMQSLASDGLTLMVKGLNTK